MGKLILNFKSKISKKCKKHFISFIQLLSPTTSNSRMKKIINNPSDFVEESIDGLIKSHPDVYALAKDNNRVITRTKKASNKVEKSKIVGEELASVAKSKKIEKVVFDRNGFPYHGRVKALAEGARENGMDF